MKTARGAGRIFLGVAEKAAGAINLDTAIGAGGILFGVAGEVSEAFGPLKAALGVISVIYGNYKVRS